MERVFKRCNFFSPSFSSSRSLFRSPGWRRIFLSLRRRIMLASFRGVFHVGFKLFPGGVGRSFRIVQDSVLIPVSSRNLLFPITSLTCKAARERIVATADRSVTQTAPGRAENGIADGTFKFWTRNANRTSRSSSFLLLLLLLLFLFHVSSVRCRVGRP